MKLRTSNIILIIKGNHNYVDEKGHKLSSKDAIKRYMSITCACPEEDYSDPVLMGIIENVVLDYIETSDQPKSLIRDYFEWSKFATESQLFKDNHYINNSMLDAWISTLHLIQVRNNDGYINGFNEYNIKPRDENTGGETLLFPDIN